eukprot:s4485_g4.t1
MVTLPPITCSPLYAGHVFTSVPRKSGSFGQLERRRSNDSVRCRWQACRRADYAPSRHLQPMFFAVGLDATGTGSSVT